MLLLGFQAERRRDEIAERARIVDVRGGDLQFLRQVRDEADDPREQRLDVAGERLDLARLLEDVGQLGELADEVRVRLHLPVEMDPACARDEDAQSPVGDAHHLVHDGRRTDLVQVVPAGRICVGIPHGHECDRAVAGHGVLDELDQPFLPDRERRHRVGEDDRVFQGQNGQRRREGEDVLLRFGQRFAHRPVVLTSIVTLARGVGFGAIGSVTCRIPRL